jgi:hypothetical protein
MFAAIVSRFIYHGAVVDSRSLKVTPGQTAMSVVCGNSLADEATEGWQEQQQV